jgi:hypothetical protein
MNGGGAKQAVGHMALPVLALLRSGVEPKRFESNLTWMQEQVSRRRSL